MLRTSRVVRFIIPSSSSPELPRFLSRREKPVVVSSGDLHAFVREYDHRSTMPRVFSGPSQSSFFSRQLFSGSLLAGVLTAGGIALFVLTFGYHIGKPVVDAHRELFWKHEGVEGGKEAGAGSDDSDNATATGEGATDAAADPVEEFDDLVAMEQDDD